MDTEKTLKSSQEQAVAAWIGYLNRVRLERIRAALSVQDENLEEAMKTIEDSFSDIKKVILRNRGGDKGIHGFIAEIAERGMSNARRNILGKSSTCVWINDNGPDDLRRGSTVIQQKFVQSGGNLSLNAVAEHLKRYPEYLKEGHKYQIPKDHYDKVMAYLNMSADEANRRQTSSGEFSLRQWKEVHVFFEKNGIGPDKLEPSILEYSEAQREAIADTLKKEKASLRKTDRAQRDTIYRNNSPTVAEGTKTAAASAVTEGMTTFAAAVAAKCRSGKKIRDFDGSDWLEVAGDSGKGVLKGGIRGVSIYTLTNYTATAASAAGAVTTASFSVAEQAHLFRNGVIDEVEFIRNSEMLCLEAAVSAISSFAGQVLIPVPVLVALLGNAAGMILYQIAGDGLSDREKALVEKYLKELADLDDEHARRYRQNIEQMNRCIAEYTELLMAAFDPDVEKALDSSTALARSVGVEEGEILDNYEKIVDYFC